MQLNADPRDSGCSDCSAALLCESCQTEAADRSMLGATCRKQQVLQGTLACCSITGNSSWQACTGLKRIHALEACWDVTQAACER